MLGIFDSALSGLLLTAALEKVLPGYPLVYYSDTAQAPFDSKPADIIVDRCLTGCRFLMEQGAGLILLACHTTSTVAARMIRQELPIPLLDVISPVTQAAVQASSGGCIGIIGTRTTIDSGTYQKAIQALDEHAIIHAIACPLLVPLVEDGHQNKRETKMILRRYLRPLQDQQIDTLVPACFHYQVLQSLIQPRIGRKVHLVDPLFVTTTYTTSVLTSYTGDQKQSAKGASSRYFVSARTNHAQLFAERLLKRNTELIAV